MIEDNLSLITKCGYDIGCLLTHIALNQGNFKDGFALVVALIKDHKADLWNIWLDRFSQEQLEILIETHGIKAQDLLGSISNKHIDNSGWIDNIKFLINKGANLKEVFKEIHKIPRYLLENHLSLCVENGFDPGEINTRLIQIAFNKNDFEAQKETFQIAFDNGATSENFKGACISCNNLSEEIFEFLIKERNILPRDLLECAAKSYVEEYSPEAKAQVTNPWLIEKQIELVNFLIAKGTNLKEAFKDINQIPESFLENHLSLCVENGFDPGEINIKLIEIAFNKNDFEAQKESFKIAFDNGATSENLKGACISCNNLSEEIVEFLIKEYKITPQALLNAVVHADINKYSQEQEVLPNPWLIEKQFNLIEFLTTLGADKKNAEINAEKAQGDVLFINAEPVIDTKPNLSNTLDILLSRSYIVKKEHAGKVIETYNNLLKLPDCKKILDFLALKIANGDELKIIFTTTPNYGVSYSNEQNNLVHISLNHTDYYNGSLEGVAIHEFAHCTIYKVYDNNALPYLAIKEGDSEEIKNEIKRQQADYSMASSKPMQLALALIKDEETYETKSDEIGISEKLSDDLKDNSIIIGIFLLKQFIKCNKMQTGRDLPKDIQKAAFAVINELYSDIENQNAHVIRIWENSIEEIKDLVNEIPNIKKKYNISESLELFLTRLGDEINRDEEEERDAEHVVRYMEFLANDSQDPRIMESYSELREYWHKYVFPKMDEITRAESQHAEGFSNLGGQTASTEAEEYVG